MEVLEYMFYFQLVFQFLCVTNQYADLLFPQLHHPTPVRALKLHERLDVVVQNLMYSFQSLSFEIFDFSSPGKYFDIPSQGLKLSKFLNS